MRTIWKFNLEITARQIVAMPKGAEILCAKNHNGAVCLWARVESTAPKTETEIAIFGTGNPFDLGRYKYIDTVLTRGDQLVWHIFEAY